ncbi:unnamed protein product [Cochlearia groenlandica]
MLNLRALFVDVLRYYSSGPIVQDIKGFLWIYYRDHYHIILQEREKLIRILENKIPEHYLLELTFAVLESALTISVKHVTVLDQEGSITSDCGFSIFESLFRMSFTSLSPGTLLSVKHNIELKTFFPVSKITSRKIRVHMNLQVII